MLRLRFYESLMLQAQVPKRTGNAAYLRQVFEFFGGYLCEWGAAYPHSASLPSAVDNGTFKQYGTNIIVGALGTVSNVTSTNGVLNTPYRPTGLAMYDKNSKPVLELTKKAVQRILK